MDFQPGSEQQQLATALGRLLERHFDFDARKRAIEQAWSPELWMQLAELGVLGLPFSESDGGFSWSAADMTGAMEIMGSALMIEPYLSTIGFAGRVITIAASQSQKAAALLPPMIAGTLRVVVAHTEEDSRYDLTQVTTSATRHNGTWTLNGGKIAVLHAPCAHKLIVSARHADGTGLFLIDAEASGLRMRSYCTFDDMPAADITLTNVSVSEEAIIGSIDAGCDTIEEAIDFATALMLSEAVGVMQYAYDQTVAYLKVRKQFGVSLGSFQALQHRAVDMMIALEQARSIALLAAVAVDTEVDPAKRSRAVSAGKIKIADTCRSIRHEAVQLHGGIGMTHELKLSHAFRRMTGIGQLFGDAGYHLQRFAQCDDEVAKTEGSALTAIH